MVQAKRRFGQHFLSDPAILRRIAAAAELQPGDTVLEIGPGPGGLTRALLDTGARVVAIEKDTALADLLRGAWPAVSLHEGDALSADWHQLVRPATRFTVVGNIPYNITSPLIDKALAAPLPERIVFLVQREVADRVAATPGVKNYGALSVGVQSVAQVERLFTVPRGAFAPAPKVDSAVLRLTPLEHPLVAADVRPEYRRLVVGLFGLRRKQLLRALREWTGRDAALCTAVLEVARLDPVARAETVDPPGFARLHAALVDVGLGPR